MPYPKGTATIQFQPLLPHGTVGTVLPIRLFEIRNLYLNAKFPNF